MLSTFLFLAMLVAFSAGVLGGFTGFGLSAIVVPLLLLVYEPGTVVVLNGVLSASVATAVAQDSWREADRRTVLVLMAAALPGLAVGAEILQTLDTAYLKLAVGVMVVVSAVLLLRHVRLPGADNMVGTLLMELRSEIRGGTYRSYASPPDWWSSEIAGSSCVVFDSCIAVEMTGSPVRSWIARAADVVNLALSPGTTSGLRRGTYRGRRYVVKYEGVSGALDSVTTVVSDDSPLRRW